MRETFTEPGPRGGCGQWAQPQSQAALLGKAFGKLYIGGGRELERHVQREIAQRLRRGPQHLSEKRISEGKPST